PTSDFARQLGVGVERDHVAHAREQLARRGYQGEARIFGAAQEPIQLLELAAFAFPTEKPALRLGPEPASVKQEIALFAALKSAIELRNSGARSFQQLVVRLQFLAIGVDEIGQERKVQIRFGVRERTHFELVEQRAQATRIFE